MTDPLKQFLAASGAVTRQARQRELMANLRYLTSLVKRGELRGPEQVAALGLPAPLVQVAILAAQRVRATPEYWEAQAARQLQPAPPGSAPSKVLPWDLLSMLASQTARDRAEPAMQAQPFQDVATDIGVQSREHEEAKALVQFLMSWLTRRGGTAPGPGPQKKRPL